MPAGQKRPAFSATSASIRSTYDHWAHGPKTFHGVMTREFPNQFYVGYIQGSLNATVT